MNMPSLGPKHSLPLCLLVLAPRPGLGAQEVPEALAPERAPVTSDVPTAAPEPSDTPTPSAER